MTVVCHCAIKADSNPTPGALTKVTGTAKQIMPKTVLEDKALNGPTLSETGGEVITFLVPCILAQNLSSTYSALTSNRRCQHFRAT